MSSPPPSPQPDGPPEVPATTASYIPTQDDQTTGMLSHLVAILAGLIGALIMYLCMTNKTAFVTHHTKESLNFQITLFIIEMGIIFIGIITAIVTGGLALFVTVPLFFVLYLVFLIFEIMACIAANKGEWHSYPFAFRFVK